MQQGFIVTCFFVGCSAFAPTVWHLWIYSGSANANFYFGVTLAFATTQVNDFQVVLFSYYLFYSERIRISYKLGDIAKRNRNMGFFRT